MTADEPVEGRDGWRPHFVWPRVAPKVEYGGLCSCGQRFRGSYQAINRSAMLHDDSPLMNHVLQMRERRISDDDL